MSEGPYVRNTAVLVSAAASPLSVSETKDQAYNCRVEGKQLQGLPSARPRKQWQCKLVDAQLTETRSNENRVACNTRATRCHPANIECARHHVQSCILHPDPWHRATPAQQHQSHMMQTFLGTHWT